MDMFAYFSQRPTPKFRYVSHWMLSIYRAHACLNDVQPGRADSSSRWQVKWYCECVSLSCQPRIPSANPQLCGTGNPHIDYVVLQVDQLIGYRYPPSAIDISIRSYSKFIASYHSLTHSKHSGWLDSSCQQNIIALLAAHCLYTFIHTHPKHSFPADPSHRPGCHIQTHSAYTDHSLRYNFIKSFKQMSQGGKRSLRERRAPKAFDSDNEDPDPYGYARPPYTKDSRTPSQLPSLDAKLFVKFINNANKMLKEFESQQNRKQPDSIQDSQPARTRKGNQTQPALEGQRRPTETITQPRSDSFKKPKNPYSFRSNGNISDSQLPQKNEAFLNRIKNLSIQSATNMRFLEMDIAKNKPQLGQPQQDRQMGGAKTARKSEEMPTGKPSSQNLKRPANDQPRNGDLPPKEKERGRQTNEMQQKQGEQKSDFTHNNNKIFKRSAYHVAICYHIYLKKLREKGPIGNEIDPTYHARKLKEGYARNP